MICVTRSTDDPTDGQLGNGGNTDYRYPAAYPGVLSVGAVAPDGSLASFSDTRTPVIRSLN